MKKRLAILLIFALLFTLFAPSATAAADYSKMRYVRVGLIYGNSAEAGINALAEFGYRIGYFDAANQFIQVAAIENRFISVAKDTTVYKNGNDISSTTSSGAVAIYNYHAQSGSFATPEAADARLEELRALLPDQKLFTAYADGKYYVRIGAFETAEQASAAAAEFSAVAGEQLGTAGGDKNCFTIIDMNTGEIIFEVTFTAAYPAVYPIQKEGESYVFLKNGTTRYPGAFEFKRLTGSNVSLINVVEMQDYVAGILPNEMSASWPLEALRAQAICARGYAVTNFNRHASSGFNLCATDDCQVYRGRTNVNDRVQQAADSTAGMVATYKGTPISTVFHSSSGGYTESNSNVWGSAALEYYTPVKDIYTTTNPWTVTVTNAELTEYLQGKNYKIGNIVDFYVSEFTEPAGNVYSVTFVDDTGGKLVIKKCDSVRIALSKYVKSPRFTVTSGSGASMYINDASGRVTDTAGLAVITADGVQQLPSSIQNVAIIDGSSSVTSPKGKSDGTYTITGTGWGHNVGMSQYGAKAMAEQGFSGEDIIRFYYTGTEVTVLSALV